MKPAEVLLLTAEQETATAVQAAVQSGSLRAVTAACRSMVELRSRLTKAADRAQAIAVVDIDGDPPQMLYDLTKAITANPEVLFVVVSREFNENLVLQAMQAGARHFLRKSAISTELDAILGRLLLHEPRSARRMGDVIAVLSCSGGCGGTIVAVNLAAELRLAASQPVLLMDLDPHYGSVGQYLNIRGKYGVGHMLQREGTVDRHLVESCAIPADDGLDVLLSPAVAEADRNLPMNYDHLLKVLEACRESHGYVVIDAPRLPPQAVTDLATISRVVVLVLRLAVRDVTYAKKLVALLRERGMAPDRILVVANQVTERNPLVKALEIQQGLGVKPLICVRTDRKKALRSTSYGKPLARWARLSGLRRDFRRIARQVSRWTANGHPQEKGV